MAYYQYTCHTCNKNFEVKKPMAESAKTEKCPQCGSQGDRVFTAPGISIKGTPIKFQDGNKSDPASGCHGCCNEGCHLD